MHPSCPSYLELPVVPELPPAVDAPELPPAAVAPALAIAALPPLPPQAVDAQADVPDAEPEPAAAVEEAPPKVPFYKKDFSLKRGSSEPKQKKAEEGTQAEGRAQAEG